ncbi:nuclear transport factor 2 family protein [Dysgonomonas sp. ZJ709]|uniref:nuclear transport factor 2 family protein n=1 Tax=Dysgonomonas sp. ZJ709 TaxID=2709797 RepID=UPI0013EC34C6|nr:nuclear transport factor 2 family protein [Dysgonomonas sp. ZJ709]
MTTKNEIIACEAKLLEAMKNVDLGALNELLHEDLLFNGPNGETITKAMDLAAYKSGNMVVDEITPSNQMISLFDDAAVVAVSISLKGQFMKQPIEANIRYIRVWKNCDNRWQVIGGGATPM